MSRIIVICGDLASGKSTLADALSYRLNISCFKKDEIKEKLVDKYGFNTREENRALSVKAVDFMFDALKRFLSAGQDIILEANFRKEELDDIAKYSNEFNADVCLFVLRGDIDVLYERFLERLPTRHKAHTSVHLEESKEKFEHYLMELRTDDYPIVPHIIDITNLNEKEVLEKALMYIKK